MDEILTQLSRLIQLVLDTAPKLWEIACGQVMATVIRDGVVFVLLGIAIFFLVRFTKWAFKDAEKDGSNDYSLACLGGFVIFILAFIMFMLLSVNIPMIINPEYYAIKVLLEMVP